MRATVLLVLLLFPVLAQGSAPRVGYSKALIGNRSFSAPDGRSNPAALIDGLAAEILEVYDESTLVYVRADALPTLTERARAALVELTIRDDYDFIYVGGGILDTRIGTSGSFPHAQLDAPYASDDFATWIVHFYGPIRPHWMSALRAAGITLIQYLPYNAFIAAARPSAIGTIAQPPFVQFVDQLHVFMKPFSRFNPSATATILIHLAVTPETNRAVARLANMSLTPLTTSRWSDEELRVVGVFFGSHVDAIMKEPLTIFSVTGSAAVPPIPTLDTFALMALLAVLGAVGLRRLS